MVKELRVVVTRKIKGSPVLRKVSGNAHFSKYSIKKDNNYWTQVEYLTQKKLKLPRIEKGSLIETNDDSNLSSKFKNHKLHINFNRNPAYHDNKEEYDLDKFSIFDSQKSKVKHKIKSNPGKMFSKQYTHNLNKFINISQINKAGIGSTQKQFRNKNLMPYKNIFFSHEYSSFKRPITTEKFINRRKIPSEGKYILHSSMPKLHADSIENVVKHALKKNNFDSILSQIMKTGSINGYYRYLSNTSHSIRSPQKLLKQKYPLQSLIGPTDRETVLESFLQSEANKDSLDDALYDNISPINENRNKKTPKRIKSPAHSKSGKCH